ncbi:MAG: arsenite efflux transporter metallochaperone ArsD [bacterium]
MKLQVFDPPMCCTSGVCGTNVDTRLVKFAGDLEWLKKEEIEVERYGLSFEPAAFANNDVVKKALETEGNECLPLIIVNNEIVYKGEYPNRAKLAKICGIELKEDTAQEAIPVVEACGADCDCHQTDVSNKSKKIIFVAVLVIIIAILLFKSFCKANAGELSLSKAKNAIHSVKNQTTSSPKILGEYIDSVSQLNLAALKQDAVFIYIPAKNNTSISDETKSAALKSQKALSSKNIKVGLYTLRTTSPDYTSVSSQSVPPAILVVYKDGSRKAVSVEINETNILQAYVAASLAGNCGSNCPCH